jgi:hypothetical protein
MVVSYKDCKYNYSNVQEVEHSGLYLKPKETFKFPSKEMELLKRLFEATVKLDTHYCTILNRRDFSQGMSGEEYDEINDILIEVEEFLKSE